ncbi:hypothetical protein [Ruminiclostridium papyrosolvens]|uniref:Uncharacterized protein n=1 Tax=Ruminiclostridium papyrosolvens C7 TaxID=1330534 RepID=U4QX22_9FIRM|nr:hypothetical protein [Ruminiclostridium papyrosolvens]EPR08126.1 hypothetical protein L323_18600 [Ruminiclostridium papyrosolvens C7]
MDLNERKTHENGYCLLPMPIKATPYQHQINAFNFVCVMFGLVEDEFNKEYALMDGRWCR